MNKCKNCGAMNKANEKTCEVCDMTLTIKEHVKFPKPIPENTPGVFDINGQIDNIISDMEAKFREIIEALKELKK